jgi:tol-pal system protein YbgF
VTRRLLALALVTSIGCSPALFSPVDNDDAEVDVLRSRIEELQRGAEESEAERDRLRERVAELESALAAKESAERPQPRLDDGIQGPSGADLESIESADIPPPPRLRELPPTGVAEAGPLPAAAQELYDRGYTLYHQSLYVDAESAFQQFLNTNSTSELADNAHYWIGEARFARADFRGALAAFRETVQRYPQGNKVPDALLRQADTLAQLGDVEQARTTYDEVIRRFPTSAAAPSARERRDQLP